MTNDIDTKSLIKIGLKSVAASFPVASSIAQAWSDYESKIQSQRIEEFFNNFRSELEAMSDRIEAVKEYIIDSEEIPSLIERSIDKIRREASDSKRARFARLLATNIAAAGELNCDDKISFIEALDTLTEQDILVFSIFKPNQRIRVDEILESGILNQFDGKEKMGRLVSSITKLESRALIGETISDKDVDSYAMFGDPSSFVNRWKIKYFELSPFGSLFYKHIL